MDINGQEYRLWSKNKSKLSNLISQGHNLRFRDGDNILYLGASSGTTASHISDLLPESNIYCVDFSEKSLKKFISRCQGRNNLYPILADANNPKNYRNFVDLVDFLYQDITQRNQVQIFEKNADRFLKKKKLGILILKAKSIDVNKSPEEIFSRQKSQIDKFKILEEYRLDPTHSEHLALVMKYVG